MIGNYGGIFERNEVEKMKISRRMFLILSLSAVVMFLVECGVSENILVAETNTGIDVGLKAATF